jgi:cytochrome c oxidase subunit II
MNTDFTLLPDQASTIASPIDLLAVFILGISVFFSSLTAILLIYFAIRYRRRSKDFIPPHIHGSVRLEVGLMGFMSILTLIMFFWSANLWINLSRPPDDSMEVYVVGKQWMWKVQHPDGQREINELHVPIGRPVKLIMSSEDVVHDFYVPAFRIKQDVLPGRYTYLWFQAMEPGSYHLFCGEYCGTQHSTMIGWVRAMKPEDFDRWLSENADLSMSLRGRQLFLKHQCIACHSADDHQRGPNLEDLYMQPVNLSNGAQVIATESYLGESIRQPKVKIVAGFQPLMPTFGPEQMDEQELQQLIAYIKSLHRGQTPKRNETAPPPEAKPETPR